MRRLYGDRALPGLAHYEIAEASLACLLADAGGRVSFSAGAALVDRGRRLRVSWAPGVAVTPVLIDTAAAIVRTDPAPSAAEYELDFDLDAEAPDERVPLVADTLELRGPSTFPQRTAIVAGPGAARGAAAVRAFAAASGIGVVNTWGAKGLFRWDDALHFGTAGLQARDWELAGVADAEFVLTVGVDAHEGPDLAGLTSIALRPADLAEHARSWTEPRRAPVRPPLYDALAAVVGPLYEIDGSPAHAAAALARSLPAGGVVAADPGPAGFWIARTFPTTELGSVVVPATIAPGFAAAAALVAALDGRAAVAVTTAPIDAETDAVLGLGEIDLRVWGSDDWPVDFSFGRALVEVAGPVVAWDSAV